MEPLNGAPRVRVPTLLAWGRLDHTMPPECAWRLARHLPHAQVHIGPGSHDWLITRPDAFTQALLGFQQSLSGR